MRSAAEAASALRQLRAPSNHTVQAERQQHAADAACSPAAGAVLASARQELAAERTRTAGLERSLSEKTDEAERLRGVLQATPSGGQSTFTAQVRVTDSVHTLPILENLVSASFGLSSKYWSRSPVLPS